MDLQDVLDAGVIVHGFETIEVDPGLSLLSECVPEPPPPTLPDPNDKCGLFEASAALAEGTVISIDFTFDDIRGPRTEVTLSGMTTHFGANVDDPLVLRLFGGPLPDESDAFLAASEMPHFFLNRRYLVFLRNSSWKFSPIVGLDALRVEMVESREVLVDQTGFVVNPNPPLSAFAELEPLDPGSLVAGGVMPLVLLPSFESSINLNDPFTPPPMFPHVAEATVVNALTVNEFVEQVANELPNCDGPFSGRFFMFPDPRTPWDVTPVAPDSASESLVLDCGEIVPETGEEVICD